PISSLHLATSGQTKLLGITRQLVGLEPVHVPRFTWCGSITPVSLPSAVVDQIRAIGALFAGKAQLRGLFGCDFLVNDEQAWLTEINPRYTASVELIEHALRQPLLDWHRRACESFSKAGRSFAVPWDDCTLVSCEPNAARVLGKIVLYAGSDSVAPELSRFVCRPSAWLDVAQATKAPALPYLADVPTP